MSVYVRNRISYGLERCIYCLSVVTSEVGIDDELYTRCHLVCSSSICENKAIESMRKKTINMGFSKKRERNVDNDVEIPWMLDNWGTKRLEALSSAKLVEMCENRGVPKSGTKGEKAYNLLKWKKNGGEWRSKKNKC
tara:strand:- start:19562 stop:19972 length:411 start_codon:yes stop_codon:yes gene_type:complete